MEPFFCVSDLSTTLWGWIITLNVSTGSQEQVFLCCSFSVYEVIVFHGCWNFARGWRLRLRDAAPRIYDYIYLFWSLKAMFSGVLCKKKKNNNISVLPLGWGWGFDTVNLTWKRSHKAKLRQPVAVGRQGRKRRTKKLPLLVSSVMWQP